MALRFPKLPSFSSAPPGRRSFRRIPRWFTLALLAAILLVVWSSGALIYWAVRQSKERDLGQRLTALGQFAAAEARNLRLGLPMSALAGLVLDLWPPETYGSYYDEQRRRFEEDYAEELHDFLRRLVDMAGLRRAMIVDIHQRAIADSADQAAPFETFDYLAIDSYEMKQAAEENRTLTTPYYAVGANDYKRSYTPLRDDEGQPFAFIRLEASRDYFAEMRQIRHEILLLSAVVTVLIGALAFIFHRLLQYLLRVEAAVAQGDRLQSVATLAAGFAHEIRNPLGIIRSSAEGLAEELQEKGRDEETVGLARDMVEEVVRLDSLVTQFLQLARPASSGIWRKVNVAEALRAVVSLARKELEAKRLTLESDFDRPLPAIQADEKALKQVFLNVLLNARDATDPGGRIRISARVRRGRLAVAIEDTGRGIPEGDLKRVFDPFFTTKKGGTGLGLSVSRSLAEQFGGGIAIQSEPGQGTTVEISLPV
ncbi:MAG: ATP-binding protein [Candidatus Sumerlaeota bacterium]|nr:ATP-binding protein [Candidatus Sumerlaeota bacterium]